MCPTNLSALFLLACLSDARAAGAELACRQGWRRSQGVARQSALHPLNPLPPAIRCSWVSERARVAGAELACRPGWRRSQGVHGNPLFIRSIRCHRQSAVPAYMPERRPCGGAELGLPPRMAALPGRGAAIRSSSAQSAATGNPLFRLAHLSDARVAGLSLACRQGWRRSQGSGAAIRSSSAQSAATGNPLSAWPAAKDGGAPRAGPGNPLFVRSIGCHRNVYRADVRLRSVVLKVSSGTAPRRFCRLRPRSASTRSTRNPGRQSCAPPGIWTTAAARPGSRSDRRGSRFHLLSDCLKSHHKGTKTRRYTKNFLGHRALRAPL